MKLYIINNINIAINICNMSPNHYSLNDYNEIILSSTESGLSYTLDKSILEIIKNLENDLGVETKQQNSSTQIKYLQNNYHTKKQYGQDYGFKHRSNNGSGNGNGNSRKEPDTWFQPAFKTTVLEKKEGTPMGDIRAYLNKMSAKNYDTNRDAVLAIIRDKMMQIEPESSENEVEVIQQIANNIFDIASTNKFYSEMYANLYKSLVSEFTIFQDILSGFLSTYTETMKNIQYVDPNENYDLFCVYNKKNDMRKATTMFIVNLMKNETVSLNILLDMFDNILIFLYKLIDEEGHVNEVDEITDNIAIIVTNMGGILKGSEQIKKIAEISTWKSKDKASLSSRAVFKFMDMMDSVNRVK